MPDCSSSPAAAVAGLSHGTVDRVAFLQKNATPTTLAKLRAGETTINREFKAVQRDKKDESVRRLRRFRDSGHSC